MQAASALQLLLLAGAPIALQDTVQGATKVHAACISASCLPTLTNMNSPTCSAHAGGHACSSARSARQGPREGARVPLTVPQAPSLPLPLPIPSRQAVLVSFTATNEATHGGQGQVAVPITISGRRNRQSAACKPTCSGAHTPRRQPGCLGRPPCGAARQRQAPHQAREGARGTGGHMGQRHRPGQLHAATRQQPRGVPEGAAIAWRQRWWRQRLDGGGICATTTTVATLPQHHLRAVAIHPHKGAALTKKRRRQRRLVAH